jgi:hypothetical protein
MKHKYVVALGALSLTAATAAHAAEPADASTQPTGTSVAPEAQPQSGADSSQPPAQPPADTSQTATDSKKKWQFATLGYVWFAGAHGQTDVIGPLPPVGLDLPFGTVLKGLKLAFMGAAEAKRDRFVILGDLMFIKLGTSKGIDIRDREFIDAKLTSKTTEVTLLGGYRVVDDPRAKLDLAVGGRVNFFNTSLDVSGPNRELEGRVKQTWFDPLIAMRMIYPLGGKWSMSLYGDAGGFGVGSDLTWQAFGAVDYQINHKMTIGAGWRHYKVKYRHGDFLYDVYQTGPIITFRTVI